MKRSSEFSHSRQNTVESNVEPINRDEVMLRLAALAMQYETLRYATAEGDVESMHDLAKVRREMKIAQFSLDYAPLAQAA
jgi:hypothetical protein